MLNYQFSLRSEPKKEEPQKQQSRFFPRGTSCNGRKKAHLALLPRSSGASAAQKPAVSLSLLSPVRPVHRAIPCFSSAPLGARGLPSGRRLHLSPAPRTPLTPPSRPVLSRAALSTFRSSTGRTSSSPQCSQSRLASGKVDLYPSQSPSARPMASPSKLVAPGRSEGFQIQHSYFQPAHGTRKLAPSMR